MKVIGLTGGIASGKSTVSNVLKGKDIPIIDADLIARDIVKEESVIKSIVEQFGNFVLQDDGTLNRKLLAQIVFKDDGKLKKLNGITHPRIKRIVRENINDYSINGYKYCIVDAALLIEAGFTDLVDLIILVYVDKDTQLQRLMKRDSLTHKEANDRMKTQMPFEEKKKYAKYIIDNSGDLEYTKEQIHIILDEILFMEDINDKKTF